MKPTESVAHRLGLTADRARLEDETHRLTHELEARTDALARSEARFRDVIERNADAIVVVDGDGLIRFANTMATKLFGGARATCVGSPFGFPLVADETTEVDLLSNGSSRVAEMRVVQSEWEGHVAYIASLRDVTERKRAEEGARALIREQAARTRRGGGRTSIPVPLRVERRPVLVAGLPHDRIGARARVRDRHGRLGGGLPRRSCRGGAPARDRALRAGEGRARE